MAGKAFTSKTQLKLKINEAIYNGTSLDNRVDQEGNTLLHLAVLNEVQESVVKLLSSGADPNDKNELGYSAIDLALDNGHQILYQLLTRREEYRKHLHTPDTEDSNVITENNKFLPLSFGMIYEDYTDWYDSDRYKHLKVLYHFFSCRNFLTFLTFVASKSSLGTS